MRRSCNAVIQVNNLNGIEIPFQMRTSEFDLLLTKNMETNRFTYM